ncbi:MAG: cold shock domain-containing protein [Vagococcus sp.]
MTLGIVKWFDIKKGYGFIIYGDDEEVFVHFTAIEQEGFKTLFEGQKVAFEIKDGARGLQASKVSVIENEKSVD